MAINVDGFYDSGYGSGFYGSGDASDLYGDVSWNGREQSSPIMGPEESFATVEDVLDDANAAQLNPIVKELEDISLGDFDEEGASSSEEPVEEKEPLRADDEKAEKEVSGQTNDETDLSELFQRSAFCSEQPTIRYLSFTVYPRRGSSKGKKPKGKKPRGATVHVTRQLLEAHFDMPLAQAAKKIGICATALKRVCRPLGVEKWPFKESLNKRGKKRRENHL